MEFREVIKARRSIRKYKKDPIPDEKMLKLYEALQAAPSGNNREPYQFIFVKDAEKRQQIVKQACHQEFLFDAPVLMVACCEKGYSFDVAIAVDHMILAATNEGLGSCWVGWFEREPVRQLLGIPETMEVPVLVPLGYAGANPAAWSRKKLDELITQEVFLLR
jgi:nitroreductase